MSIHEISRDDYVKFVLTSIGVLTGPSSICVRHLRVNDGLLAMFRTLLKQQDQQRRQKEAKRLSSEMILYGDLGGDVDRLLELAISMSVQNVVLRECDRHHCFDYETILSALGSCASQSKTLESIDVEFLQDACASVSDEAWNAFSEGISHCQSLRSIRLQWPESKRTERLEILSQSISNHTKLLESFHLCIPSSEPVHMNNVGPITQILQSDIQVQSLVLDAPVFLSEDFMSCLAKFCSRNRMLQSLTLSSCQITTKFLLQFLLSLPNMRHLKALHLDSLQSFPIEKGSENLKPSHYSFCRAVADALVNSHISLETFSLSWTDQEWHLPAELEFQLQINRLKLRKRLRECASPAEWVKILDDERSKKEGLSLTLFILHHDPNVWCRGLM